VLLLGGIRLLLVAGGLLLELLQLPGQPALALHPLRQLVSGLIQLSFQLLGLA
jgi:hypothetical protein